MKVKTSGDHESNSPHVTVTHTHTHAHTSHTAHEKQSYTRCACAGLVLLAGVVSRVLDRHRVLAPLSHSCGGLLLTMPSRNIVVSSRRHTDPSREDVSTSLNTRFCLYALPYTYPESGGSQNFARGCTGFTEGFFSSRRNPPPPVRVPGQVPVRPLFGCLGLGL